MPASTDGRCFAHDAGRQAALKESRAAGGRGRSTTARATRALPPHLAPVQQALLELVDEVRDGTTEPGRASAIASLAARLLDLAKFSLEVGEQKALTARLDELEAALGAARRGRHA